MRTLRLQLCVCVCFVVQSERRRSKCNRCVRLTRTGVGGFVGSPAALVCERTSRADRFAAARPSAAQVSGVNVGVGGGSLHRPALAATPVTRRRRSTQSRSGAQIRRRRPESQSIVCVCVRVTESRIKESNQLRGVAFVRRRAQSCARANTMQNDKTLLSRKIGPPNLSTSADESDSRPLINHYGLARRSSCRRCVHRTSRRRCPSARLLVRVSTLNQTQQSLGQNAKRLLPSLRFDSPTRQLPAPDARPFLPNQSHQTNRTAKLTQLPITCTPAP